MKRVDVDLRFPSASISADLLEARRTLSDRFGALVSEGAEAVRALSARGRHSSSLDVNVVGIGLGEKFSGGRGTGALSVKVLVARKYPRDRIAHRQRIPSRIDGIATDVQEVGYPRKLTLQNRLPSRPLAAGASISPSRSATGSQLLAGTLGVLARKKRGRGMFLVSNNHVVAYENSVPLGGAVLQPGTLDGGADSDVVARLSHVVPLRFGNRRNWMDAAAASLAEGVTALEASETLGVGRLNGTAKVELDSRVRKSGRTTGLTDGIVRTVKLDVFNIQYDGGMVRMEDVFAVEGIAGPFSDGGDSGSGIIDSRGAVVGLLFAGTDQQTFAIPMQRVMRRLGMRIA